MVLVEVWYLLKNGEFSGTYFSLHRVVHGKVRDDENILSVQSVTAVINRSLR